MASGNDTPDSQIGPTGPMYIFDLLEYLKARDAASWQQAVESVRMTRRYGATVAKASMLDQDICLVRTHIGSGLFAEIEFERDRLGQWQPVLGQIVT